MIKIYEESDIDVKLLDKLLDQFGNTEYNINEQLILDDINKLNNELSNERSKSKQKNLKSTIDYLNKVKSKSKDGSLYLSWGVHNNKIVTYPVELKRVEQYNINITDYFVRDKNSLVSVEYTRVMDMIAFFMAHSDMGYSWEDVEEKLQDMGMIAIYDSELLKIPDISHIKAKGIKVNSSSYANMHLKEIMTFFPSDKPIKLKVTYKDALEKSYDKVMTIIAQHVMQDLQDRCGDKVCVRVNCVLEDSIQYMAVNGLTQDILNTISKSIILKVFGRRFEVRPTIQIY